MPEARSVGYAELVRTNANFRRLWGGNVVSLFGDWFNFIAIFELVKELTGSEAALGFVFLAKILPLGLASPVAGVLVDRLDRRKVMIAADLGRAVVVLGFLLVGPVLGLWAVYVLAALQITISALFNPAKSASLPNITSKEELLTANALMAATWSTMLALGAAAGGPAVEFFGTDAVFVFDAGTYLVSAWFIARTTIPQEKEEAPPAGGAAAVLRQGLGQIADGWRHLREHPRVGRIALAKAAWGLGGYGPVFMLVLLGEAVMPGAPAIGYSLLLAARGVGTGLGPVVARAAFPDGRRWPALLGWCVGASGLAYFAVGLAPWTLVGVAALVLLGHVASGTNWVLSTTLLQQRTADRYRGRVFATDWLLVTVAQSLSIVAASLLLEWVLPLRAAFLVFGAVGVATGVAWMILVVPRERAVEQAPSYE